MGSSERESDCETVYVTAVDIVQNGCARSHCREQSLRACDRGAETVMALQSGTQAPDIAIGRTDAPKLSKLKGKELAVVYFYPTDMTFGCTIEAQEFRDLYKQFRKLDTEIIGISVQGEKTHARFSAKEGLPFPLAPDEDRAICKAYDVWSEAKDKAIRSTFLIGKDGKIARVWPTVKARGHAAEVLAAVKELT